MTVVSLDDYSVGMMVGWLVNSAVADLVYLLVACSVVMLVDWSDFLRESTMAALTAVTKVGKLVGNSDKMSAVVMDDNLAAEMEYL